MIAVTKLASDESSLFIFYECSDDEQKIEFVINLFHLDLPPSRARMEMIQNFLIVVILLLDDTYEYNLLIF